ncbi:hypothetical protein ABK951_29375, partial [Klebsiella oxytoca]
ITTNGIRTVHWDIVRHGNICGGEPVMGKAIKSVWKYRGQSTVMLKVSCAGDAGTQLNTQLAS